MPFTEDSVLSAAAETTKSTASSATDSTRNKRTSRSPSTPTPINADKRSTAGKTSKFKDDYVLQWTLDEPHTPNSYKDTISSPDADKWQEAMREEYEAIKANGTYELVPLPPGKKVIDTCWVYKMLAVQKLVPFIWGLLKAVETLDQPAHVIRMLRVLKTFRLLNVELLLDSCM